MAVVIVLLTGVAVSSFFAIQSATRNRELQKETARANQKALEADKKADEALRNAKFANAAQDRAASQEALGVLQFLCAQPIEKHTLIQKIRDEQTISDVVRQRTLELAETYWQWEERHWVTVASYRTAERKQRNLLRNGSFENQPATQMWRALSWRNIAEAVSIEMGVAHDGNSSALLAADIADHVVLEQREVAVNPNTDYLLSGWVKTKGVHDRARRRRHRRDPLGDWR